MSDDTGLQLILAGDDAAADAHLRGDWPNRFYDVIRCAVEALAAQAVATSSDAATVGTGTKTFTLAEVVPWRQDFPVFATAGSDDWMWGHLTADPTGDPSQITIDVEAHSGSAGTFTGWKFALAVSVAANLPSAPYVATSAGGFGVNASEAPHLAADAVELHRSLVVLDVVASLPGSPSNDDTYLVSSGADENLIKRWNGSAWETVTVRAGDAAYDATGRRRLLYQETTDANGVWLGSRWVELLRPRTATGFVSVARTFTLDELIEQPTWVIPAAAAASFTLTLPSPNDPSALRGLCVTFANAAGSGVDVTISGSINDGSSVVLAGGAYTSTVLIPSGSNWWFKLQ